MQSHIDQKHVKQMMLAGIVIAIFGCVLGSATMMIIRLWNIYFSMTGLVIILCGLALMQRALKHMETTGFEQSDLTSVILAIALGASLAVLAVSIANHMGLLGLH